MRRLALVATGIALVAACSSFDNEQPATAPANDGGTTPVEAGSLPDGGPDPGPVALCTDLTKCPAKPLALKLPQIYGLTADADYIYAGSDGAAGKIYRISKSDGVVVTLAEGTGDNAKLPILHGSDVYYATDKGVYKVPKTGSGGPQQVSPAPSTALAFAGDTLFGCRFDYAEQDVLRVDSSADGGVGIGRATACESLSTNGTYLFFGGYALGRVRTDGNDSAMVLGSYASRRVIADGDYAYTTAYLDGEVRRIKIDGAASTTSFETVAKYNDSATLSGDLALDATHVYWTIGSTDGKVFRAPKAGGTPELIADKFVNPYGITVDDHAVYWSEHDKDILWVRQK